MKESYSTSNDLLESNLVESRVTYDPKTCYTNRQKSLYVFIVAIACFLSPISTTMFLPAIPEIADTLHTTGSVINISNSVYAAMMAVSPCISSPLGDIYGRKYVSVVCSLGYTIGSFLTGASQDLAMFYVFRAITALFGSAFFSLGATIVSDLFIPQERGRNMSYILFGGQFGTAISPLIGGILIHYANWRVIFFLLGGIGAVVFVLSLLWLPETAIDTKLAQYQRETSKKFKFFSFNPLSVLFVTRYETVLMNSLICAIILYSQYAYITPLRYVVDDRFKIKSALISSLFYLPSGLGNLTGSVVGGKLSDATVKYYIKKRNKRIAEDRLRSTLAFLGLLLPVTIIIYGWSIEKKFGGIALPVIMLFMNGLSQTTCFPSINAYSVDSMPHIASDSVSNSYVIRFIASGIAGGTILPEIEGIGIGWTSVISAIVLWIGFVLILILILYGESLRRRRFPEIFED